MEITGKRLFTSPSKFGQNSHHNPCVSRGGTRIYTSSRLEDIEEEGLNRLSTLDIMIGDDDQKGLSSLPNRHTNMKMHEVDDDNMLFTTPTDDQQH